MQPYLHLYPIPAWRNAELYSNDEPGKYFCNQRALCLWLFGGNGKRSTFGGYQKTDEQWEIDRIGNLLMSRWKCWTGDRRRCCYCLFLNDAEYRFQWARDNNGRSKWMHMLCYWIDSDGSNLILEPDGEEFHLVINYLLLTEHMSNN